MVLLAKENKEKVNKPYSDAKLRPIPYLPHTHKDREEMFNALNITSIENLLDHIPKELRKFELNLPEGKSEIEIMKEFQNFSKKNISLSDQISFCGGGVYNRYIPSVINEILSKGEFYTAYTPYQPEVSQGTLQTIYEFQTVICSLTGMDVCNASLYDGLTSTIEAALMCKRITKRNKILVSKGIHPDAQLICKTYAWGANIELQFVDCKNGTTDLEKLEKQIDENTACFVTAYTNFAGNIEFLDKAADIVHKYGAKLVSVVDLISLAILKSPKDLGVDIVIGDGQSTGNLPNYGGPHLGFISCLKEYVRQLPGRLVGLTKDIEGNRAFTLTLQTREQHIRRKQATSNICTNQSLNALAVLVYLAYMGPYGLRKIAEISLNRAHYLQDKLKKICKPAFNTPFFNEFVLDLPIRASEFIAKMTIKNILPGIDLEGFDGYKSSHVLVSVTEMNTIEQIDHFVKEVEKLFK